ncbi:MAG: nitrous oxide-stimulated promoter family protein [Coriobacteriia bacterium]
MKERLTARLDDFKVRHDIAVLGDFAHMYCAGNHRDRARAACATGAAVHGVYGRKVPLLCRECAEHLDYAEARRAACTRDPKPFCAHCDAQCYRPQELEWQRTVMQYAGPRSWYRGHLKDGIRHAIEGAAARRTRTN